MKKASFDRDKANIGITMSRLIPSNGQVLYLSRMIYIHLAHGRVTHQQESPNRVHLSIRGMFSLRRIRALPSPARIRNDVNISRIYFYSHESEKHERKFRSRAKRCPEIISTSNKRATSFSPPPPFWLITSFGNPSGGLQSYANRRFALVVCRSFWGNVCAADAPKMEETMNRKREREH